VSTQHGELACLGKMLWKSKKRKEAPTVIIQQQVPAAAQLAANPQPVVFAAGPGMYYTADGTKAQEPAPALTPVIFAPQQPQFSAAPGPFMWSGPMSAVPADFVPRTPYQQPVQVVAAPYAGQQPYGGYGPQPQQYYGLSADGRQVVVRR
jgi:hypothetical protein